MEEDSTTNPHASAAENARFAAFSAALERDGFSPITRACYASDWWTVSEYAHGASGGKFRLQNFTAEEFILQRAELAARGTSPATLNRRLSFLRRYSAFAAERDSRLREIAAGFAAMPFQSVPRRITKVLTEDEEKRLRAAADADGLRTSAIVALILGTGLRAAEVSDLTRGDVVGPKGAPTALRVRGERAKTARLAPLSQARIAKVMASDTGTSATPLFRGKGDQALGEDGVADVVERAARAAGVEATPRTLRHTFAVRYLAEHGDDVDGLAQALGQSSAAAARAYQGASVAEIRSVRVRRWQDVEATFPLPGVRSRRISASKVALERELLAPGARVPARSLSTERITVVLSGQVELIVGGSRSTAVAGEVVTVPSGVSHELVAVGPRSALLLHAEPGARRSRGA
jgi:integrase/recombinase XerD